MAKSCVICGGDEAGGDTLLEAPCQRHWVCTDDVVSFFERATENESLYPPKCCGQMFLLDTYEQHVPFDTQWAFQMKEQGEYSVLAKYRVYCANPSCSKFISPASHVKDPTTDISYAICMDDACRKLTCTTCKALLDSMEGHSCECNEDHRKFKETAAEKGFKECPTCASTVELSEACNHILCQCGAEFCYVCGESWQGMHGCPHYGPAIYDEGGYNQDGFHRDTGLDREGQTRLRAITDADNSDEDADDDADEHHFVLQHVDAAMRATFNTLLHQDREAFILNLQIQLFEERGVTFDLPDEHGQDNNGTDDEEEDEDIDDLDEDGYLGDIHNRTKDEDRDTDGDGDTKADANDEDLDTTEQSDSAQDIGQSNLALSADITTQGTEESFDAIAQGLGASRNSASSSATSPDTDRPATPMEVDSAEQGIIMQAHGLSTETSGSWPDNEEL